MKKSNAEQTVELALPFSGNESHIANRDVSVIIEVAHFSAASVFRIKKDPAEPYFKKI